MFHGLQKWKPEFTTSHVSHFVDRSGDYLCFTLFLAMLAVDKVSRPYYIALNGMTVTEW
jgi:hypothetical protein